jgi:hypothetical protein
MEIKITEKVWGSQVKDLTKVLHCEKYYHPFLSTWSEEGFPDCTIIKIPRLIFAELKSEKGKLTPAQEEWLELLKQCKTIEAYCWRPSQFEEIAEILR